MKVYIYTNLPRAKLGTREHHQRCSRAIARIFVTWAAASDTVAFILYSLLAHIGTETLA